MDALELLRMDHGKIRGLFRALQNTLDERLHRMIFAQIRSDLVHQCHLKESIFYPLFERYPELRRAIQRAYSDQDKLRVALNRISKALAEGNWRKFDRRLRAMIRTVERHMDAEEIEIFPVVERIVTHSDRHQLGQNMKMIRERLSSSRAA